MQDRKRCACDHCDEDRIPAISHTELAKISRLYATRRSICRSVLLNERALNAIQQA